MLAGINAARLLAAAASWCRRQTTALGRSVALYHRSGAQAVSADERQLRLDCRHCPCGLRGKAKKEMMSQPRARRLGGVAARKSASSPAAAEFCRDQRATATRPMSPRRGAFIDIGTNTILCLIADIRDTGRFRVLDDLAEIARLGSGRRSDRRDRRRR